MITILLYSRSGYNLCVNLRELLGSLYPFDKHLLLYNAFINTELSRVLV